MKWIKKTYLQCIPLRFGVSLSFYWFFWLHCVTTVTPFVERSEGWSLRSVGVLDQSQQEWRFFRRNSNPLQTFQLQPKTETSSSSLEDHLEKRSIISPSNLAICAGLRDTSGFRPVPVTTVALTNQFALWQLALTRRVQLSSCTVNKRVLASVV